jgi:signal transduction histidine kinase
LAAAPIAGGVLLRDLTALRRAQEDARELLAVLSHELRTPVTAIRAALEALETDPPESVGARFLARASTEAERLVRLLEDLTVDVRPPRERSVELSPLAARAVAVVQARAARHAVRLELEIPEVSLWVDEDKLLQVLINLLENAVVHGPDDARVRLVGRQDPGGLRLEVWDEGRPLDPGVVEALFQPHSRGNGVKAKGTGLGLYIVRSIAERWGGGAWGGPRADGHGNAFGVSVPARGP